MITSSSVRMQERMSQLWGPRRRVPGEIVYLLPGDRYELERMCFENHVMKAVFGRTFFAPLSQPSSVLDVGCGPGSWAAAMCYLFPHARVVGLDIVARALVNTPPNYSFIQGSVLQPLPFADNSFEYVHQRLMWHAIPAWAWRSVIAELVRVTKPGGYIELVEATPGLENNGPATAQITNWLTDAEKHCGIDIRITLDLPALLDLAGARTFMQRVIWVPVGSALGHRGSLMEQNLSAVFASYAPMIEECLSLPREQYQRGWNLMKREWTWRQIRCPLVVTIAQKMPRRSLIHQTSPLRAGKLLAMT